jgi:hypothetical protein
VSERAIKWIKEKKWRNIGKGGQITNRKGSLGLTVTPSVFSESFDFLTSSILQLPFLKKKK